MSVRIPAEVIRVMLVGARARLEAAGQLPPDVALQLDTVIGWVADEEVRRGRDRARKRTARGQIADSARTTYGQNADGRADVQDARGSPADNGRTKRGQDADRARTGCGTIAGQTADPPPAPPREEGGSELSDLSDQGGIRIPTPLPPPHGPQRPEMSGGKTRDNGAASTSENLILPRFNSTDLGTLWSDLRKARKLGAARIDRTDWVRAQNACDVALEECPEDPAGWCARGIRNYLAHARGLEREKGWPFWGWAKDPSRWALFDPDAPAQTEDDDEDRRLRARRLRAELQTARLGVEHTDGDERIQFERQVARIERQLQQLGAAP